VGAPAEGINATFRQGGGSLTVPGSLAPEPLGLHYAAECIKMIPGTFCAHCNREAVHFCGVCTAPLCKTHTFSVPVAVPVMLKISGSCTQVCNALNDYLGWWDSKALALRHEGETYRGFYEDILAPLVSPPVFSDILCQQCGSAERQSRQGSFNAFRHELLRNLARGREAGRICSYRYFADEVLPRERHCISDAHERGEESQRCAVCGGALCGAHRVICRVCAGVLCGKPSGYPGSTVYVARNSGCAARHRHWFRDCGFEVR